MGEEANTRIISLAPHQQLSGIGACNRHAIITHDAHIHLWAGFAKAVHATLAGLLIGGNHRASASFCHRPCFHQRNAKTLLKRNVQLGINASAKAEPNGMRFIVRRFRQAHQNGRHHTQIMQAGCTAIAHILPPGSRMETVQNRQTATNRYHNHGRVRHRIHMEDRQRRDHPLAVIRQCTCTTCIGVPMTGFQKIPIGQHAPLWATRRARGVKHRRRIILRSRIVL